MSWVGLHLYFGSHLLLPEPDDDGVVDMPDHLAHVQRKLFLFEAGFWLWAILINPVAFGEWGDGLPFGAAMVAIALAMAFVRRPGVLLALAIAVGVLHLVFTCLIALTLP